MATVEGGLNIRGSSLLLSFLSFLPSRDSRQPIRSCCLYSTSPATSVSEGHSVPSQVGTVIAPPPHHRYGAQKPDKAATRNASLRRDF